MRNTNNNSRKDAEEVNRRRNIELERRSDTQTIHNKLDKILEILENKDESRRNN